MTKVEIICIALLSLLIVSCIVTFILDWRLEKIDAERDRKIDEILNYVEDQIPDDVFPEFTERREK